MKKIYYILLLIALSVNINAQITINGERSFGAFLIDGAGDDPITGTITPAHTGNDVLVDGSGKVAIGAIPNNTSLRVNGPITIKDGNQAQDRLLVSDANGKASWKSVGGLPYVVGFIHSASPASGKIPNNKGTNCDTGNYIDLPPGTFAVTVLIVVRETTTKPWSGAKGVWLKLTLSDSPSVFSHTPDFMYNGYAYSGSMNVGSAFGIIKGMLIVKNNTPNIKRYFMVTITASYSGGTALSFPALPDNKFYAIRLND